MEDREILKRYIQIAEAFAQLFSPILETVVHDYRSPEASVIHVSNGHVTGRKVGDPITSLGEQRLSGDDVPDHLVGYESVGPRGNKLKCASIAIRNTDDQCIGALCCNVDVSYFDSVRTLLEQLSNVHPSTYTPQGENYRIQTPREEIQEEIRKYLAENGLASRGLDSKDKRSLVQHLHAQGCFTKRGAVTIVAEALSVTRPSVYHYLKAAT